MRSAVVSVGIVAWLAVASAGSVQAAYPADCLGSWEPSSPDCAEWEAFGYEGCCDSQGRVIWCDFDGLYCIDCAGLNPECGWQGEFYDCGTSGEEAPSKLYPKSCDLCDPPCGSGFKCQDGTCVVCVPDCTLKQCGSDGCGGSCGDCSGKCIQGKCNAGPGCEPSWVGGCGGCDCEACVCEWDSWCCQYEWDSYCVDVCIEICGGCFVPPNCGDGTCKPAELETCANCPKDCLCAEGQTCFEEACCTPQCEGKVCGPDGCGGTCGKCPVNRVCDEGACVPNDGCFVWEQAGCGDCICEECVCDLEPDCCSYEWDYACIGMCVAECGGCGFPPNCGDGTCKGDEGESCVNCPSDCPCKAGEVCYEKTCCMPHCGGKECGDDSCGGTCGECTQAGTYCIDSKCEPNNGCIETAAAGCDGCACEACVCAYDDWCCYWSWDFWCVGVCEDYCGGCASLENCGDGTCQAAENENCTNCPEDCACPDDTVCYLAACCTPDCTGKDCGDDGCGGDCGACPSGEVCMESVCTDADGCISTYEPGCGGCKCEDCVCNMDYYCCDTAWDSLCVDECVYGCEGCGKGMENCGDGICQESEGEDCSECPGDCTCDAGEKCFKGSCCVGDCTGKQCGSDGCGGTCGACPCDVCSPDQTWCDDSGQCIVSDGATCAQYGECLNACDDYDDLCFSQCESEASSQAVAAMEAWGQCVVDAGYWDCWDLPCVCEVYGQCADAFYACYQGTKDCAGLWACMEACGVDSDCAGDCISDASLDGFSTGMDLLACAAADCGDEFSFPCMQSAAEDYCTSELDQCLECKPACGAKECGDDGCGGSCGSCPAGVPCVAGLCECVPDCKDKECGDDGCGGSCGECEKGMTCSDDAVCVEICVPDCADAECGDDGCGSVCGECDAKDHCVEGECVCKPLCEGRDCGPDACDGTCGSCTAGQHCSADGKCVSDCQPQCDGMECGPDGCGGECGACAGGDECLPDGTCPAGPSDDASEFVEAPDADAAVDSDDASAGCGCRAATGRVPSGAVLLGLLLSALFVRLRSKRVELR